MSDPLLPRRSEPEAERKLAQFKTALDEHAIVAITDAHGIITYVNDKFCEISGYAREELLGQDHRLINSGKHPSEFFRGMWLTISAGRTWKGEICNRAKNGSLYWVETTIVPFLDPAGRPAEYIAIRTDITVRKRQQQQIVEMLEGRLHDTLRTLEGILPVCGYCKDIRCPDGHWARMEEYISTRSKAVFSHGICPKCVRLHHPDFNG
jgi:two-component system, chemotaxis family, sensor kinase Cph1